MASFKVRFQVDLRVKSQRRTPTIGQNGGFYLEHQADPKNTRAEGNELRQTKPVINVVS